MEVLWFSSCQTQAKGLGESYLCAVKQKAMVWKQSPVYCGSMYSMFACQALFYILHKYTGLSVLCKGLTPLKLVVYKIFGEKKILENKILTQLQTNVSNIWNYRFDQGHTSIMLIPSWEKCTQMWRFMPPLSSFLPWRPRNSFSVMEDSHSQGS